MVEQKRTCALHDLTHEHGHQSLEKPPDTFNIGRQMSTGGDFGAGHTLCARCPTRRCRFETPPDCGPGWAAPPSPDGRTCGAHAFGLNRSGLGVGAPQWCSSSLATCVDAKPRQLGLLH